MKKTTIKVSWDNLQQLNRLASRLSEKKQEKITQDIALRYLLENNKKEAQEDKK